MLRFCGLINIIRIHIKADSNDRTVSREMHDTEYARTAAGHLLDPGRVSTFINSTLLFFRELFRRGHAHHCFFLDGICPRLDLIAEVRQRLSYLGSRAKFRPARFRVRMQIAAALDHCRLFIISKFQDSFF